MDKSQILPKKQNEKIIKYFFDKRILSDFYLIFKKKRIQENNFYQINTSCSQNSSPTVANQNSNSQTSKKAIMIYKN